VFHPEDITPLTDFQRNAKKYIRNLKASGRAAVLTVNGRAAVVIQDPKSYERMVELARRMDDYESLERSLEEAERGEGTPWEEVKAELLDRVRRRVAKRRRAS